MGEIKVAHDQDLAFHWVIISYANICWQLGLLTSTFASAESYNCCRLP
jgi:hypothetical protein